MGRNDGAIMRRGVINRIMSLPRHIRDAIEHYLPPLDGWTTPERGIEMAEIIYDNKPEVVVTIGVFGCRSVIAQAFALRENQKGVVYGLDPFKLEAALEGENSDNRDWWSKNINIEDIQRKAINSIWQHNLDQWAVLIRASSQHVSQLFPEIGVLEIDGNHSEIASCRDVELYLPKVVTGGFIWADDCDWPTTQRALTLLDAACDVVSDKGKYRLYRKR